MSPRSRSPIRRGSAPALLAAVVVGAAALAGAGSRAMAQGAATAATEREFTTPDGSRFLLVPDLSDDAVPVLHWTVAVPSGPHEDPAGLEGLARATVRASLAGTVERGSRDWGLERRALETLDELERRIAVNRANGDPVPPKLLEDQRDAASSATRLGDPTAWRRALGDIPATPHPLVESDAATLLTFSVAPADAERLADLILDWREHAVLRGVRQELDRVRGELRHVQDEPSRALRREILGLAYLGSPAARTVGEFPASFGRDEAQDVFRSIVHPRRCRHVITGGFDAASVRRVLDAVFVRTDLPPISPQAPPPLAPGLRRSSEVPTDGPQGVAIACAIPPDADPTTLEAAIRWLADGESSRLAVGLRQRGFRDLQIGYRNPFPDRAGAGLVLLEARAPAAELLGADIPDLKKALTEVLETAVAEGPREQELRRASRSIATERRSEREDPIGFGRRLAMDWGIREKSASAALDEPPPPNQVRVAALAKTLWTEMPRTTAHLTRSP